ncbi:MAG: hypothetical protein OXC07_04115, partial [Kistimonas sp.]|nr:hypothetical protein [Kistimonas sp.]
MLDNNQPPDYLDPDHNKYWWYNPGSHLPVSIAYVEPLPQNIVWLAGLEALFKEPYVLRRKVLDQEAS